MLSIAGMFLKGFFKNLLGGNMTTVFVTLMIGLLGFMIVPNYDKVAGWFGYKTRTVLIEDLKQANTNTATAVDANKTNVDTIKVLEETVVNTEKVLTDKVAQDKKVTNKVTKIKEDRKTKIDLIESGADTEEVKIEQVSSVNIDTIWQTYCSLNPNQKCNSTEGVTP